MARRGLPCQAELGTGAVITRAGPAWFVAAAARDPGSGAVRGYFELSAPRRMGMPGLWRPGLGIAFVLLIVALAAAPLARRISQPVERLTEAARRLGGGDLGYRVALDDRVPAGGWRREDELHAVPHLRYLRRHFMGR